RIDRPNARQQPQQTATPRAPADTRPPGDEAPGPVPTPNPPARPRPNEQRDDRKKKGETKAGLDIFRWLVPEAHAAEPHWQDAPAAPVLPAAEAPRAPVKAREQFVDADDDIVWLSPSVARLSRGAYVQRGADH